MLRDTYSHETQEKGKTFKNKPKTTKKMPIGIYIYIYIYIYTYLHVNGLNPPTKLHRLAECLQK